MDTLMFYLGFAIRRENLLLFSFGLMNQSLMGEIPL